MLLGLGRESRAVAELCLQSEHLVEAMGYRDLSELEREHDKYGIKALDAQRRLVKIDVDPFSGDVINTKVLRSF